ncbi:GNAT family N-acetyltransferase [Phreatobacter stygius]|uniref:N-acetyltransferase n=1 Tax=Phreatobacter stygius TaxID=1940610 RepID=A0A4D7AZX6_9HYPH|nr:N-acetyltransferase [Phreatobacter stygius]QCI64323.1 N-acetyltransferase [Phreatobacter stygius]
MTVHATDFPGSAIVVADERDCHIAAREALLDVAFGADRREKTSERLREGRRPADGLALAATSADRLVGTVRLWNVTLGPGRPALLLGPIAVDPALRSAGIGGRLMNEAVARAAALGHRAIVLVGDEPYYRRFGFSTARMDKLWLPGPVDRARLLGRELVDGALDGVRGLVSATGASMPRWRGWELAADARVAA